MSSGPDAVTTWAKEYSERLQERALEERVEMWESYRTRLRNQVKWRPNEAAAVTAKLQEAVLALKVWRWEKRRRGEVKRKREDLLTAQSVITPAVVKKPPRPKYREPLRDAPLLEWEAYSSKLALAGLEDTPEYARARCGIERAKRRDKDPAPYYAGRVVGNQSPTFRDGKKAAHHLWLTHEQEEGASFYYHEGRKVR